MAIGAWWIAGCGTEGEPKEGTGPVFNPEVRCLSCGTDPNLDEQKTLDAQPRMIAAPLELFFYPDATDSPELEPKPITVVNGTDRPAAITHALVGEDSDALGGSPYFHLTPLGAAIWLEPDATAQLFVSYLGSEKQQSAVVVIYTSAPETPILLVPLTGKFFFDG